MVCCVIVYKKVTRMSTQERTNASAQIYKEFGGKLLKLAFYNSVSYEEVISSAF